MLGGMEAGRRVRPDVARTCAIAIELVMNRDGDCFRGHRTGAPASRSRKPDTGEGWETVRRYEATGVPLAVFLHQRAYGGSFRQLLDATSSERGDLVEDAMEKLLVDERIPYVRTGAHNQAVIEERFGLTVKPAPDFVLFDSRTDTLKAILECKGASDGGTARDKASTIPRPASGVAAARRVFPCSRCSRALDGGAPTTRSARSSAIPMVGPSRWRPCRK